jgi:hypothetical protein
MRKPEHLRKDRQLSEYIEYLCVGCGQPFHPRRRNHLRCKQSCGRSRAKAGSPISKAMGMQQSACTGAASELLVSVALMRQGYYVFRALDQYAPVDLLAMHPETREVKRVQVKTGRRVRGQVTHKPCSNDAHDLLVVVIGDEIVFV